MSPGTLTHLSWVIVFSLTRARCRWLGHMDPMGSTIAARMEPTRHTGSPVGPVWPPASWSLGVTSSRRGQESRRVSPRSTRVETRTVGAGSWLIWQGRGWGTSISGAHGADKRGLASRWARRGRTWEHREGPHLHPPSPGWPSPVVGGPCFPLSQSVGLCLLGRASAFCLSTAHTEAAKCPSPRKRAVRREARHHMADT